MICTFIYQSLYCYSIFLNRPFCILITFTFCTFSTCLYEYFCITYITIHFDERPPFLTISTLWCYYFHLSRVLLPPLYSVVVHDNLLYDKVHKVLLVVGVMYYKFSISNALYLHVKPLTVFKQIQTVGLIHNGEG